MMTRYLFAGQMAVVEFLLNRPDRNEINPEGITALHQAARFGQTAVLELLLSRPEVDVNAKDNEGKTALRWALNSSQVSAVELLFGRPGAGDLNEVDNEGNTALHRGIRYSSKLAEFLVRRPEVDVNKVNNEGKTPLHVAIKIGLSEFVEILLSRPDVEVNACVGYVGYVGYEGYYDGETALHYTARIYRRGRCFFLLANHHGINLAVTSDGKIQITKRDIFAVFFPSDALFFGKKGQAKMQNYSY